jgi:hypothetical protein
MRTLPAIAPSTPQLDDDQFVPDDLVGRLYRAGESAVADLLGGLSLGDRANLAMYCYRKSHLRRTGLAIAATCDLASLVQAWGTALGQAIFAQSREPADEDRAPASRRAKITLARTAGLAVAPLLVDEPLDDESLDDDPIVEIIEDVEPAALALCA